MALTYTQSVVVPPVEEETPVEETKTSTNLTSTEEAYESTGVGVATTATASSAVITGAISGAGPATAYLGISQCQSTNTMSMINVDQPDSLYEYTKSYESCQMSGDFGDEFGLYAALSTETRRLLSPGYTPLTNLGFNSGSFLLNYCYFFLVLIVLMLIHLTLWCVDMFKCCEEKAPRFYNTIRMVKGWFEFSVYIYLMIFASLFIFILTLNEIAGPDFSTGFNVVSYFISVGMLLFMVSMIIAPAMITTMFKWKWGCRIGIVKNPETFCERVCSSYWNGLKLKFLAMNYYSFSLTKSLIMAVAYVFIRDGGSQIAILVLASAGIFFYCVFIRPFESHLKNVLAILNEAVSFTILLIMIKFLGEDSGDDNVTAYVIMALTGVSILACLIVGNLALALIVYELCKTKHRIKKAKTMRSKTQMTIGGQDIYDDDNVMSPAVYGKGKSKVIKRDGVYGDDEAHSPSKYGRRMNNYLDDQPEIVAPKPPSNNIHYIKPKTDLYKKNTSSSQHLTAILKKQGTNRSMNSKNAYLEKPISVSIEMSEDDSGKAVPSSQETKPYVRTSEGPMLSLNGEDPLASEGGQDWFFAEPTQAAPTIPIQPEQDSPNSVISDSPSSIINGSASESPSKLVKRKVF